VTVAVDVVTVHPRRGRGHGAVQRGAGIVMVLVEQREVVKHSGRASVSVDGRGGEVVVVSSSWSTGVAGSLSTGVLGSRGAGESRERWCDGVC
jgi:hypothetical protein